MKKQLQDIKSVFVDLIENHPTEEWDRILDLACGKDDSLRREVEKLLKAHQGEDSFLDHDPSPAVLGQSVAFAEVLEKPGDKIGNYKLLEQIGEGGMGIVYMADQTEPVKRRVALKIIKPGMDTKQVVARFEAERQVLAIMDHPNIAKVFDAGVIGEPDALASGLTEPPVDTGGSPKRPYFVMELVRGIPITDYCDNAKLTTTERLKLFVIVCQAVQHAHQKGIIHRDIKPSNILVSVNDGVPVPKVIDFGVAKAINQELTEQTLFTNFATMIGTPLYMSPEQAEMTSLDIDTRSDIYSLGVLLYELLTGSTPFEREKMKQAGYDEMRRIIREDEPQNPSSRISTLGEMITTVSEKRSTDPRRLSQTVRGDLDWIVMKALEKNRNRRYESASAFAADVNRYLNDEPIEARPPSTIYRLKKFAKRKRAMLTGVSLVTLTLLVSVIVGSVLVWNERNEMITQRIRAEKALKETRATIDKYVETVQNAELLKDPRFKPLMKELLKDAFSHYQRFVKEHRHDDSGLLDLSKAMYQVARISAESGDFKEAIEAYQEVIEIRERLVRENPTVTEYQSTLAWGQNSIGFLYEQTGKRDESLVAYQKSLEIWERLVRENPIVTEYQSGLATCHHNTGNLYTNTGNLDKSIVALQKALEIKERLVRDNPKLPDYKHGIAGTLHNIGNVHRTLGRSSEAIKFYRKASEISEKIVRENPDIERYRNFLANHENNLGLLYTDTGKQEKALVAFQRALKIKERLVRENPTATQYQSSLAMTLINIANLYTKTDKQDESLEAYRRALEMIDRLVRENPTIHSYRDTLAANQFNIGLVYEKFGMRDESLVAYQKSLEIRERLVRENPTVPGYRSKLAGNYNTIGGFYSLTDKPDLSLDAYQKAQEILKSLIREYPKLSKFQSRLADRHNNIGLFYEKLGKKHLAIRAFQEALIVREKLNRKNPNVTEYQGKLANSYYSIGNLYFQSDKLDQSLVEYEKAMEIQARLVRENPNVTEHQSSLAKTQNNIGLLYSKLGNPGQALLALEKALEMKERLVRDNPHEPDYKHQMAGSLHNIACEHDELGRSPDAIKFLQKALQISSEVVKENPHIARYRVFLSNHYAMIGRLFNKNGNTSQSLVSYEEAIEVQKRLVSENPKIPVYQKNLANSHDMIAKLLATTSNEQICDPKKAIEHAQKAVELTPQKGDYWNTLVVAHNRAGDMQSAIEALGKSMELRSGGDPNDWLFLAMAEWKLGNQEKAHEWYANSVRWMEEKKSTDRDMLRYRNEAANLLGLPIPATRPKSFKKKLPLVAPRPKLRDSEPRGLTSGPTFGESRSPESQRFRGS